MSQLIPNMKRAANVGKRFTSYESVETQYDPGQPEVVLGASENLSTPSSKLRTTSPKCQEYKPTALRWWFHGFLIACLAMFLGLTEYAILTLLVSNLEDLPMVSQLWSRSDEEGKGNRPPGPQLKWPTYQRLARVPGNATFSQAGAYPLKTGDFPAPGYSSSTWAAFTDSQTTSSTELLLSFGEPTDKTTFVPTSPSPTTLDPESDTIVSIASSPIHSSLSLTRASSSQTHIFHGGIGEDSTSGYLEVGMTTATVRIPSPDAETGDVKAGQTTTPAAASTTTLSQSPENATDGYQITLSSAVANAGSSAYLEIGTTSFTVTPMPTLPPSAADGGLLSLGVLSTTKGDVIDPASPSQTFSKVAVVVSENALVEENPITTVIQQTETWAPSKTTLGLSSTDSDGGVAVQRIETTLPGGTSVSLMTKTLSPEVSGESVTVIRQTEAWHSSKVVLERTTTDSRGYIFVGTSTMDIPAETSVLETTLTVRPGESLVAVPKMVPTTRGGITQVMQRTYIDPEGHTTTSSHTTVIGENVALATHNYFLATSLPPGYTVIMIPTTVPTTEGGTIEILQTIYTDAQGRLTTSSYTTTLHGTPTSMAIPVVMATPVFSVSEFVTLSTVVPTTIGGTTKVIKAISTDSQGHPSTFSYTTVESGISASTTFWTVIPTPTSTSPPDSSGTQDTGDVTVVVYGIEFREYILGAFLPTVLATILAFPFKLININARLMQPFHELATAREAEGVSANASIFLRFYDWAGALSLPRSIKFRQPVIIISDLLVLGAALLAPIAAETVSVHVPDDCFSGCHGRLGVTVVPGRILEALAAAMISLLIALIVLINVFRWETGVSHNPWSIAGMASLGLDPEMRDVIRKIPCDSKGSIKEGMILKALAKSKYALDDYWVPSSPESFSARGYGIVVRMNADEAEEMVRNTRSEHGRSLSQRNEKKKNTQPFSSLTWWGRCILLFIFACVLIIATYYENTSLDSGFERFMDSRGFGIRFFFTALGVVIGGCMETFFRSVAIMSPYQQLSKCALPAERSVLLSPPTNAFYGLYSAARKRSIFLGAVSFTTVLAELFLPVTLSHVPFSHLDTYETQLVCTWLSISILGLMILVIFYSFFIRWPNMPVDPRTIAGAMFYVCDSWMLGTMEGIATRGKKERDTTLLSQRLRYEFVSVEGVSGKERMCVDICRETGEAAAMIRGVKTRYG